MHLTKDNLKKWNKNRNGNDVSQIREECIILQNSIDSDSSDTFQINKYFHMLKTMGKALHTEAINLRQKAKIDWILNGDLTK